jgi:hypothetical protein
MTSYISITDLFCGSGGSSEGMAQVSGVEIKHAANHWQLALETHAKNHPGTEHFYCDIQETHPSVFRKTTGLWASPSCTNHTVAKGRKRKGIDQLLPSQNIIGMSLSLSRMLLRHAHGDTTIAGWVKWRNWDTVTKKYFSIPCFHTPYRNPAIDSTSYSGRRAIKHRI